MKRLSSSQSVKEFNETLKEGIKYGFILKNSDLNFLKELYVNLTYYFTFFISAEAVHEEKE